MKKLLALLLAAIMVFSMVACNNDKEKPNDDNDDSNVTPDGPNNPDEPTLPETWQDPYADLRGDHDAISSAIYKDVLGEFKAAYDEALNAKDIATRYALMAVAEAKLLESAIMVPTGTQGGNYAMSRLAPYTVDYTLWGNDMYRYHQALVCKDFLKTEDRTALKAKWAELKGTGTYLAEAKAFLAEKGYQLKDSYTQGYTADPENWDVLGTSLATDSEALVNTYDGLLEYDVEGTLQPALAESYTMSDDGLTYTFKIRPGQVWVDAQGKKVADVKADDFVAGMQHMLDAAGGLEYLVCGVIANAAEYIEGEVTFDKVGVKAVDDTTLVYTLAKPTSYFLTMLGYGVFAPMSRTYYQSLGGKFGDEYDPAAENYTYGTAHDKIAYCGPYTITNFTEKSTIVFSLNESYWNKDNINLKTITWLYNDGKDTTKAIKDAMAGTIDGCGLTASSLEIAKDKKPDGADKTYFDLYGYVSSTNATSFSAFHNINRTALENAADGSVKSDKTEEDLNRTRGAMLNVHFRRAISFAFDRGAFNAQAVGEELKLNSVRNTYTPGTYVTLPTDATIKINGVDKTYAKGTLYGQIMQDQVDADGVKIKVWDPKADDGVGSSDGFDGWYNVENARAELAIAIEELAKVGIKISADNPIYLDYAYPSFHPTFKNKAQAYKQSIETALEGKVKIKFCECKKVDDWYNAGYFTRNGAEANYDMYDLSGWGPDYGDPQTYLDTFLPDYAGFMTKCIGIF